jgi:hypothetical protein
VRPLVEAAVCALELRYDFATTGGPDYWLSVRP